MLMSIESVMLTNHLILCRSLLLLLPIFPSITIFFSESALRIRWPKYWSFNFSISPSNEYSGLISFRMDWFDWSLCNPRDSQESSPTPQFKSINSSVLRIDAFCFFAFLNNIPDSSHRYPKQCFINHRQHSSMWVVLYCSFALDL